jgi:hypothetical protein
VPVDIVDYVAAAVADYIEIHHVVETGRTLTGLPQIGGEANWVPIGRARIGWEDRLSPSEGERLGSVILLRARFIFPARTTA